MINRRVGKVHRRLRMLARLTQKDLSHKSGVSVEKIARIEADLLEALRLKDVERSLGALGAELEVRVRYRGAEADRVLDELHARIVALVVAVLQRHGWEARVEVTYSEFGERGSYDILAWHRAARILLVVEVKSELPSVEGTLRPLDAKVRLARKVADARFGWQALAVSRVLVLPEDRTARRAVDRHATVLRAALPAASRKFRGWLRAPSMPIAAIWFVSQPQGRSWLRNPSSVSRVRSTKRS
ncbi:hypothetical protein BH24CHL5_BH24CHL5_04220 [soil metagenome]